MLAALSSSSWSRAGAGAAPALPGLIGFAFQPPSDGVGGLSVGIGRVPACVVNADRVPGRKDPFGDLVIDGGPGPAGAGKDGLSFAALHCRHVRGGASAPQSRVFPIVPQRHARPQTSLLLQPFPDLLIYRNRQGQWPEQSGYPLPLKGTRGRVPLWSEEAHVIMAGWDLGGFGPTRHVCSRVLHTCRGPPMLRSHWRRISEIHEYLLI